MKRTTKRHSAKRRAFTLIELIVVLAILAVLLVVIVPRVTGYVSQARETAAKNNASAVLRAAELYVVDRERDGANPAGTFTNGSEKNLDSYLDNFDEADSYSITIDKAANSKYKITGIYTSGDITIAIPTMEKQETSGN